MLRERIDVPFCNMPPPNSIVCITAVIRADGCFIRANDLATNRQYSNVLEAIRNYSTMPNSLSLTEQPIVGQVVLAKNPRLPTMSRVLVLRVPPVSEPEATMAVAFIDYGNLGLVRQSECKQLPAELQRLTRYVHRVTVRPVEPDSLNNGTAVERLEQLRGKRLLLNYVEPFGANTVVCLTVAPSI